MYFGDFLISKKIITEEQLLDALVLQVEGLPSFLRILREDKLFTANEILNIVKNQCENNSDIATVLRDERKIDEKKLNELYLKQVINRKMLGRVLVELKYVDESILEKMLYEFLRDKDNVGNIEVLAKSKQVVESTEGVEISEAALQSMRELGISVERFISKPIDKVGNIFVEEFLNTFSEKLNNKLIKLLSFLKQSLQEHSTISNYLNSIYYEITVLKGAASLGELHISFQILEKWTGLIENKLELDENKLTEWGGEVLPVLIKSLEYLWKIREVVLSEKDEGQILSTPVMSKEFHEIMEALNSLK